jgi:HD superfamily phosphohydrolase
MYIASKLFEAVVDSSRSVLTETYGYTESGLARDWQIVRLAALIHDIGHAPFSHATEDLLPMKASETYSLFPGEGKPAERFAHEDYSVAIIQSILADVIYQHPLNRRNAKITAEEVTTLIAKRSPPGASLFWKDVISGQLDADRMDYLLRDSLHAGVSYGKFDLNRIVSSVCAIRRPSEESSEPKIALTRGGGYAAEALIVARYWMHKQVYFHKTRIACNHHLEEAVRSILNNGKSVEGQGTLYPRPDSIDQLKEFLQWDDNRVMGHLVAEEGGEHGRSRRRLVRVRNSMCRPSGHVSYSSLVHNLNITEMKNNWVTHSRDELEQAFAKGFELSIKEVTESGFVCDSSPAILAGNAVNILLRVVEGLTGSSK